MGEMSLTNESSFWSAHWMCDGCAGRVAEREVMRRSSLLQYGHQRGDDGHDLDHGNREDGKTTAGQKVWSA